MARVQFTGHLKRYFPELASGQPCAAATVSELVITLDRRHPGLRSYLLEDDGSLRKHVNIFVGKELVRDRARLTDPLKDDDEVFILQALSGG
jgi:molybdopterin converting factor small subunit